VKLEGLVVASVDGMVVVAAEVLAGATSARQAFVSLVSRHGRAAREVTGGAADGWVDATVIGAASEGALGGGASDAVLIDGDEVDGGLECPAVGESGVAKARD